MIDGIRRIEQAMGQAKKRPTIAEQANRQIVRRSLVAAVDIPQATAITEEMLIALRPATGISPALIEQVVGRLARERITAGALLSWSDLY